ncbi:hypothetical protein, partial [Pseudomonas canadensis]
RESGGSADGDASNTAAFADSPGLGSSHSWVLLWLKLRPLPRLKSSWLTQPHPRVALNTGMIQAYPAQLDPP